MNCLRTTNLTFAGTVNNTSTVVGSNVTFWLDYSTKLTGFVARLPLVDCSFNPQGFKNIDLYGLEVIGYVSNNNSAGGNFICTDYSLLTKIMGQFPLLSGTFGTGVPFQMVQGQGNSNGFTFTKTHSKINFNTPIKSVSQIFCSDLTIEGTAPTLIGITDEISFDYSFDIFLHYKFEGE
jgi:hypothetical protein